MEQTARVESTERIEALVEMLKKLADETREALSSGEHELRQLQHWLERDQQTYWSGQLKKRTRLLADAEQRLRQKRLSKSASGEPAPATEEQIAAKRAKRAVEEAQQKLMNIKRWLAQLETEGEKYRARMVPVSQIVDTELPNTVALLQRMLESLDAYFRVAPESAAAELRQSLDDVGLGLAQMPVSFVRDQPIEPEAAELDAAALRGRANAAVDEALQQRQVECVEAVDVELQLPKLGAPMQAVLRELGGGADEAPAEDARGELLIDKASAKAKGWLFVRLAERRGGYEWLMLPREGECEAYGRVEHQRLVDGRADVVALLELPAGAMVVFDQVGPIAVYSGDDARLWPSDAGGSERGES